MRYNIVETNNPTIILASCQNLALATKMLKDMHKTDKYLQEYYGWKKLPKYQIIEVEEV